MRIASIVCSTLLVWNVVFALPFRAIAQQYTKVKDVPTPITAKRRQVPPRSLTENLRPLTVEQKRQLPKLELKVAENLSLLDPVGRLSQDVRTQTVADWKTQLHSSHIRASKAARLYVWLGEWELANNQHPQLAIRYFRQAQKLSNSTQAIYGLATYDSAIAAYYEGAYAGASRAFHHILMVKPFLHGFDRRNCSLFLRHAEACAGYHDDRAKMGITEPTRLDPLCGVAGMSSQVVRVNLPWVSQS